MGSVLGFLLSSSMGRASGAKLIVGIILLGISIPFIFRKKSTPIVRMMGFIIGGCAMYDFMDIFVTHAIGLSDVEGFLKHCEIGEPGCQNSGEMGTRRELPPEIEKWNQQAYKDFQHRMPSNGDESFNNTDFDSGINERDLFNSQTPGGWYMLDSGEKICCNINGCMNPSGSFDARCNGNDSTFSGPGFLSSKPFPRAGKDQAEQSSERKVQVLPQ
jgi:hypothetical protein